MKKRYDGSEAEGKSKRYNFTTNKAVSEILEPIKNKADYIREAIVFYAKNKDIYTNAMQRIKDESPRPLDSTIVNNLDILEFSIVDVPEIAVPEETEVVIPTTNFDNLGLNESNIITNQDPKQFLERYDRPILARFYVALYKKSAPKKKPYVVRGILQHYRNLGKL